METKVTACLLPAGALLDEIDIAVQRHGRPLYAFFTTYTFDEHLFASQFLPLLCGEYAEDERKVGLIVVCDARMYSGHRLGPWVTTWPRAELFHSKVALLLFRDLTLLMAGSANLTYAGQYQQIELVGKEMWDRPGLPEALVPIVTKLEGPLPRALLNTGRLQSRGFSCSLKTNFATRLKRGSVDEIIVVSPFFDARESAEPDDLGFIADLIKHHQPHRVQLVVPMERGSANGRTPTLLVDVRPFQHLGSALSLYGIDPADAGRQLHAKVVVLCHRERARLLFGSANATMAGMSGKNIEAGWFAETTRSELIHWLRIQGLFGRPLDPKKVLISKKVPGRAIPGRSPLRCARLDEVEETLTMVWRTPNDAVRTEVLYEGKPLLAKNGVVSNFRPNQEWFVRTRVSGHGRMSFAPIEIERELAGARHAPRDGEATAESLLDQLVASPQTDAFDTPKPRRRRNRRSRKQPIQQKQPFFERIRRLAEAMAVARRDLKGELPQRMATLALLRRIARAHNPKQAGLSPRDALWRYWVRAEVARVIAGTPQSRAVKEAREALDLLLDVNQLPSELRKIARDVRNEIAP